MTSPHPQRPLPLLLALAAALLAAPMAQAVTADGWQWNATTLDGTSYLPLEDLRSFYKFTTSRQDAKAGTHTVSNGSTTLVFGPEPRALTIGGYRCRLSQPVRVDERGNLLVPKVDMVKLIDPILRPTYIASRREVKAVVIDPGHGGHDIGQQTPQLREADFTLTLARQLAAELRRLGYEPVLTREDNQYLSDQQRIDRANGTPGAVFVSLHANGGRSDFHGIETYCVAPATPKGSAHAEAEAAAEGRQPETVGGMPGNEQDAANAALAFALHSALIGSTGAQDGACRRARYSLLSSLRCPAALVELGYATHAQEGAALATEEYRATLAAALAQGIDTFAKAIKPDAALPVNVAPPPDTPPTPVKVAPPKKEDKKAEGNKGSTKKTTTKGSSRKSGSSPRRRGKKAGSRRR